MRRTLNYIRMYSRIPALIGLCQDDIPGIAAMVNEAQLRLLMEFGETGPFGCWEKVLFTATRTSPYITLGRHYCRAINLAVCRHPIRVYNEFYTVLPAGPGLPPDPTNCTDWCGDMEGYDAGTVPTMVDLPATSFLRLYATDPADVSAAKRILISGLDQNGQTIYSQDGFNQVQGFYLTAETPFVDSTFTVSKITAINKDVTVGNFILKAVNPTTGVETTLSTYEPGETTPSYRRYQITALPDNCCVGTNTTAIQITALCKLEYIPVAVDTDYLVIGNIPALTEECQSLRMAEMDDPKAMSKSEYHHKRAIKLLNAELRHYLGEQVPSIAVDIWENQPLQDQQIGSML